jgi:hypothetical protein
MTNETLKYNGESSNSDLIMSVKSFTEEAERIVEEIKFGVVSAQISNVLERNNLVAFIKFEINHFKNFFF